MDLDDLSASFFAGGVAATALFTDNNQKGQRKICLNGCERPVNVCLCERIPKNPIPNLTQVVILHHPHEQRHKLATVPILSKCLQNCEIIVGRKLRYGVSKLLDSLYDNAVGDPNLPLRAMHLFPGEDASPLAGVKYWENFSKHNMVLIAFDGTWKHAKEMMQASLQFLSKFSVEVCLDYDDAVDGMTKFNSDLTLRKEPFGGCMSTMEAVARGLRVLDPHGTEVESSLIDVLRDMVKFQASFLKPMKPRPKLLKKNQTRGKFGQRTPGLNTDD